MADIGSAYLTIFPSMSGFGKELTGYLNGVDLSGAGKRMGSSLSKSISAQVSDVGLKGLEDAVVKAEMKVRSAMDKSADAAKELEIAQKRLSEARAKYPADSSQVAQAELRVQQAQRKSAAAAKEVDNAQGQLAHAQKELEAATESSTSALRSQDGAMDSLGGSSSGLSGKLSAITGAAMGVAAELAGRLFDAVLDLGSEMVEASDSAQKFASTLSFAGIDDSTIQQLTESTQAYADQTVYDLADIRNATAQLAANGVKDYATLAEAAGNLNAVAGGNAETFKSVSMVMSQTAGSGRLMAENWNQLTDAIPGASGALQEAMREAGAFEGNFREAMENGEISADEFFAAVQKLGMQDVAVEAATSTSTIEGALGNLQASVVGVGSQVVSALTPLVTQGMTAISTFVSGIPGALAPIGEAIQTALSGGGTGGIAQAILTLMTGMSTSLVTGIQTLAAQLPTYMQSVVPILTTGLTTVLTSLMAQLPTILMSLIGLVVTGITSFASSIASQLPVILPQLAAAAMGMINSLVTQVLTNLPTYVGQMVQAAIQLFQGIVNAIPRVIPMVVTGITELVHNVLTNLPSFLGQMIDAAVTLFNGIVTAIPQVVPAVLDGIAQLLQNIWNEITSFDLIGAGADLIQGLIDGIASMGGAVLDAIGGVVGGAIDWAKSLLGIASPSKVFRQFGGYTMEGFALGISDEESAPVRALRSAMSGIEEVAASRRLSCGISGPGYAAYSRTASPAFPTDSSSMNQEFNIYANDPNLVAAVVAQRQYMAVKGACS